MKAVILAGGKGARLAPYTTILPKPLMPLGDMPILEILLRQIKNCGIDEAILTVGHLAHLLQSFFQDGKRWGMNIQYSFEDQPLGTAGPLSLIETLDNTFLVSNGDVLTNLNLKQLIETHKKSGAAATIATHFRQVKIDLGVIEYNSSKEIVGYIEKPRYDFFVSMGIYVFEPRVREYIPYNQYLDFPDLVLKLIENKERVMGFPFDGYWQDLGHPEDYAQAVIDFEQMKSQILGE
jgi:NDP-sugar pyrophosphorylase family protein